MPTQYALEKAAQAWCGQKTSSKIMDVDLAEEFAAILDHEIEKMKSAGEYLWIVLANVGNGKGRSWEEESEEWQKAAKRARNGYCQICSETNRKTA